MRFSLKELGFVIAHFQVSELGFKFFLFNFKIQIETQIYKPKLHVYFSFL